jgi:hypothetical protein
MVTKCANPSCGASFRYLRGGKLFLLDLHRSFFGLEPGSAPVKKRVVEYFWLCDRCSAELTVTVDASGRAAIAKAPPANCA